MTHAGRHFCQWRKGGLTVVPPWRRLLDVRFKLFPALSFLRCIAWTWYGNYFDLAHFIKAKSIKEILVFKKHWANELKCIQHWPFLLCSALEVYEKIGICRIKVRSILSWAWSYCVIWKVETSIIAGVKKAFWNLYGVWQFCSDHIRDETLYITRNSGQQITFGHNSPISGTRVGLPYLKKQNAWQSQWLLYATTIKQALYDIFQCVLTRTITNPSQNSTTVTRNAEEG